MRRKIFIFCLLLVISSLVAEAKKLKVAKFDQLTTDISARLNQREDFNGEKCALIKVFLPIEGCRFEGNIGDTNFDVNEYWVYVSPGTRRIKVKCPGFETLDVDFGSYSDISRVEPLLAYGLEITDYDQLDIIQNPDGNMLALEVIPTGVRDMTVTIDGRPQPMDNGRLSAFLKSGRHTYSVTAPGYIASNGDFTVTKEKGAVVKVRLKSEEVASRSRKSTDIYGDIYGDSFDSSKPSSKKLHLNKKKEVSFERGYRGNVEFGIGLIRSEYDMGKSNIVNRSPIFEISTSHGYQLTPNFFIGAGVGIYTPSTWAKKFTDLKFDDWEDEPQYIVAAWNNEKISNYAIMFPIFLDFKFELGVHRRISPYLDLRAGYQFGIPLNKDRIFSNLGFNYKVWPGGAGFYFRPSLGVRFRIYKMYGISIGLAYNPMLKSKFVYYDSEKLITEPKGQSGSVILGFDF